MYKVLWIDDEYNAVKDSIEYAKEEFNLEIHHEVLVKEGLDLIKNNPLYFQAVIFDVRGKYDDEESVETDDSYTRGISEFNKLSERYKVHIPYFICSGQESIHTNSMVMSFFQERSYASKRIYNKLDHKDMTFRMFDDIVKAIETNNPKLIKYRTVYKVCTDDYLGADIIAEFNTVIELIEKHETNNSSFLNPLRCILERMFNKIQEQSLIPQDLNSLNEKSIFLGDKYWSKNNLIPEFIQSFLYSLNRITNPGSHDRTQVESPIKDLIHKGKQPSLISATFMMLQSVMDWFIEFYSNIQKFTQKEKEEILMKVNRGSKNYSREGVISEDQLGNYHHDNILLPKRLIKNTKGVKVGDKIIIHQIVENTNNDSKGFYSWYARKIEFV